MLPQSLYIHIPWCIKKCPYCDFNSHKSPDVLPETEYIQALLRDLDTELSQRPAHGPIHTIFIGGGTPSLFTAKAFEQLFNGIQQRLRLHSAIEITLEANPGAIDLPRFKDYRQLGINRLSLGIQSFDPYFLKTLGRIHGHLEVMQAIDAARHAGFDNLNFDLMHGLPKQSIEQGLMDLRTALSLAPEHLSWYQLTIEPNTIFYKSPPPMPTDDHAFLLEQAGLNLLAEAGFERYEISAFTRGQRYAAHNLNYWLFGDYYGIGAGAHGKWTSSDGIIYRTRKQRQPKDYLNPQKTMLAELTTLSPEDCLLEYMLNTTRLMQAIAYDDFNARTHQPLALLMPGLLKAQTQGFVRLTDTHWQITPLGLRFNNDLQSLFLP
jgi:oxygen-independent coproporphyrinogen-3 oxidase